MSPAIPPSTFGTEHDSSANIMAFADHSLTIERRAVFHAMVAAPSGPYGCMEWTGATNTWGYGLFKVRTPVGRVNRLAHRIAFHIAKGDPSPFFVRHACDNPRCCNPAHLSLGTQQDNENDKRRPVEERLSINNDTA